MIAFAIIDAEGLPIGGGIRRALPEGAIALEPPLTTADLTRIRWTGTDWIDRAPVPTTPPSAEDLALQAAEALDRARTAAMARVDHRAGVLRAGLVTGDPGQWSVHAAKRAEAAAWLAAAGQGLNDYPLLAAEIGPGLTAATADQLAQVWLNQAHLAATGLARIEGARIRARTALATAPDAAAIEIAEVGFTEACNARTGT